MEKQKRWQLYLILAVIVLTVYNILPTIFYYSKPLKDPINEKRANSIELSIIKRTNSLESQAIDWIDSFCKLLQLKPQSVAFEDEHPQFIHVTFKNTEDAGKFKRFLPRAGALIPFIPSQLSIADSIEETTSKTVTIQRRIPIHFDPNQTQNFFQFSPKINEQGQITALYRALVQDRSLQIGIAAGGISENASLVHSIATHPNDPETKNIAISLAQNILSFVKVFGENAPITQRFFANLTQIDVENRSELAQKFLHAMETSKDKIRLEKIALQEESKKRQAEGRFLDAQAQQRLDLLQNHESTLVQAEAILKKHLQTIALGKTPWNYNTFGASLQKTALDVDPSTQLQVVSLEDRNPYIAQIVIDWANDKILLRPYEDLLTFKKQFDQSKGNAYLKDQLDQLIYNEIATISRQSGEAISPFQNTFEISLNQLTDSKSFLAMRLGKIAEAQVNQLKEALLSQWMPKHPDLSRLAFPIWDYETYMNLPLDQKALGIVIYAPATQSKTPPKGFRMNSIYVIAKGMDKILQKLRASPQSEMTNQFVQDFNQLKSILQRNNFFGYSGSSFALGPEYSNDFIFESEDYYQSVLKATRENFSVHGTKRYAVLEFSDVEQRILTENRIETKEHEDLLKWRDDYYAAQLNMKGVTKYDVPKPTKNVLWNNFKLSFVKYFRGDDRKVLHWGLDLSGGKTVQIELRDNNNKVVSNEADLRQGINELYKRVNKMGVSEVSIRQEGNYITLDFPGSQNLSAAELVKASSMFFHVVNEKFSPHNSQLADALQNFLQDVWNEAVVTNRKDPEDIQSIAWKQIHGESFDPEVIQPRSEAARILYENGLKLANPQDSVASSNFNDTLSKIAILRGNDFTDWEGQTHPLMVVFQNFVLEGSSLENVHASYDPAKGNFLAFGVKSSQTLSDGQKINPRDALYSWTSQFSKEKVQGTPLEAFSNGRGWRMAVILNGSVISAPTLESALRDSAMITGSFTQREVNQLEADLKAGSLSFTPRILSEKNVSPELGKHEKMLGIVATIISLMLVVGAMVAYYRFGGVIASIAVVLNILIMWATLQNLQATLTLASIAGLILTVGTAVDANVLVFERIREEFNATGRIASAVHAGYRKAFSAIIDSNITTIIAALILLHFDSGPIKAFAVTLIVGIISSMFTALFMTRYFFAGWVQNPENKSLKMANFIKSSHFNFLKHTKLTIIVSSVVILIGGYLCIVERQTMLGMDFTGGYAINLEIQKTPEDNYREKIEAILISKGASPQDFQIRELNPSNQIRLFLSRSMEQPGRPFYGMPLEYALKEPSYAYQTNPKIVWIVQALESGNLHLTPSSLEQLDQNWSEVSGQMSNTMRNNAFMGLILALLCILVYITIRFEFKYAISATLCLAHDVIFTVAVMAILHTFKVPLQIDLNTVAALMTIIGYSLNDTIIVFDRIREDVRLMRKHSFIEVINHALNVTLSRTLMTSGTTLLVLIPLVALGGSTIFGFALVMIIGVIFGTLSSLFIAAPLMLYFHNKTTQRLQKLALNEP